MEKFQPMSDHVFICYAREDEAFVLQLGENLKGRGVPVWLDQWDIPPGSDWDRVLTTPSTTAPNSFGGRDAA